ncbi:MAG: hypothetical protein ACE5LF_10010 [Alphaproteobacteria bacterium]
MAEIIDHMRIFGCVDEGESEAFDPAAGVRGALDLVSDPFRAEDVSITAKGAGDVPAGPQPPRAA